MELFNKILADFYIRDIKRLIEEVNLFKNEDDLWKVYGTIKNTSGNLVLHITGGTNYLIGALLAKTGYVRNRDLEFSNKYVEKTILLKDLESLISLVVKTISEVDLEADFPIIFDDEKRSNQYVLTQLLFHFNYHLGQINYLRRCLE